MRKCGGVGGKRRRKSDDDTRGKRHAVEGGNKEMEKVMMVGEEKGNAVQGKGRGWREED